MKKQWLITFLMFSGFLLVSCTLPASEDAIATAIAETAQVEEFRHRPLSRLRARPMFPTSSTCPMRRLVRS